MKKSILAIAIVCTAVVSIYLFTGGILSIKDYRTNRTITAAVKKAHRQYGQHATYITALKQLMDASNKVSNQQPRRKRRGMLFS